MPAVSCLLKLATSPLWFNSDDSFKFLTLAFPSALPGYRERNLLTSASLLNLSCYRPICLSQNLKVPVSRFTDLRGKCLRTEMDRFATSNH